MDTYICAAMISLSNLNAIFEIIEPIILCILKIFKIYKYEITNNDNRLFLQTKIKKYFCINYNDENKPIGWIIGYNEKYIPIYICKIFNDWGESNEPGIILLYTTTFQKNILTNKNIIKKEDKDDESGNDKPIPFFKVWDRNLELRRIGYSLKSYNLKHDIPNICQKNIIKKICDNYEKNNNVVCFLYGKPGKGKTYISYLLASKFKCSFCKTFNPTDPGDKFSQLYSIIQPKKEDPLVLLWDEFNIDLEKIHGESYRDHPDLCREVSNKRTLNNFLDNFNLNFFPYVIVLICSNDGPEVINRKDKAYIRKGRVNLIEEVYNNDEDNEKDNEKDNDKDNGKENKKDN